MYSFVTEPNRHPFKCISCLSGGDREWWLDLGEDSNSPDEVMITVYICNLCFVAMAQEKGIVDQVPLQKEIEELKEKLFDKTVIADGMVSGLNGLLRARFISSDDPNAIELVSFLETVQGGTEREQSAGEGLDSRTGETAQSSDVQDVVRLRTGLQFDGGPT